MRTMYRMMMANTLRNRKGGVTNSKEMGKPMKLKNIELTNEHIGKKVIYTPFEGCDPEMKEEGVITSFKKVEYADKTNTLVFVRYDNDVDPKATRIDDLEIVGG